MASLLGQGTYAIVTAREGATVRKSLPRYDEEGVFNLAAISDLAVNGSFAGLEGFPGFIKAHIEPEFIHIDMPHHGFGLHTLSIDAKRRRAIATILDVANACRTLQANGIQHTDIKPANVLVKGQETKLIDFNLVSMIAATPKELMWTPSFGTWQYAAPEIVHKNHVADTSSTWSIGLMLVELLDVFPIDLSHASSKDLSSRTFWRRLLKKYQEIIGPSLYFQTRTAVNISKPVFDVARACLRWNPKDRLKLDDLVRDITGGVPPEPPPLLSYTMTPHSNATWRHHAISLIDSFLRANGLPCLFVRSVTLFDRATPLVTSHHEALLYACAAVMIFIAVGGFTYKPSELGEHLADYEEKFAVTGQDIERGMWALGEHLSWRILEKPGDALAVEAAEPSCFVLQSFKEILLSFGISYKQADIARVFKEKFGNMHHSCGVSSVDN